MDRLEQQLARLEAKINTIARACQCILGLAVGFGAYLLTRDDPWALYYGLGAGLIAAGAFGWQMRRWEMRFRADE